MGGVANYAHELSDYSGQPGFPINGGEYTQPLIGLPDFAYNQYNRMLTPVSYTHPSPSDKVAGSFAKGQVPTNGIRANFNAFAPQKGGPNAYTSDNRDILPNPTAANYVQRKKMWGKVKP